MDDTPTLTISIVSRAQIHLVENLLNDFALYCMASSLELIITLNINETLQFDQDMSIYALDYVYKVMMSYYHLMLTSPI